MPDHQANPATGEIIDVDALSDRDLLKAVCHQNNDILAALVDVLKAVHAVQKVTSDVLAAAKGEHKSKDGVSMKDELHEFQGSIRTLVKAVGTLPQEIGAELEATLVRVVGDGAAVQ